jgi:hypothetical protein
MDNSERSKWEKFLFDSINEFEGPFEDEQEKKVKSDIKKLSDCELAEKCEFADYLWDK